MEVCARLGLLPARFVHFFFLLIYTNYIFTLHMCAKYLLCTVHTYITYIHNIAITALVPFLSSFSSVWSNSPPSPLTTNHISCNYELISQPLLLLECKCNNLSR